MWYRLADFILKYRLYLIVFLALMTGFMLWSGRKAEMSYDFIKVVPSDDPDLKFFKAFRERFGQDDNILAVGLQDSSIFQLENFKKFATLCDALAAHEGIEEVMALPRVQYILKNKAKKRFDAAPLFEKMPDTQAELDSILAFGASLKFYEGRLFKPENGAQMMLLAIKENTLNSKKRFKMLEFLEEKADKFEAETGIHLRFAGVPYVRSAITTKVKQELNIFLVLSLVVTALILFLFFRSFSAVIFPLMVIGMVVIWTLGTLGLLGFKITILTGLLPTILVVIGIPNCIYLLNKYHQEFSIHGNQGEALRHIIRHIGIVTLITNATTAIGFIVLISTDISILIEFGIVAGINIVHTFIISIIFIPAVFSYRPKPEARHIKHLKFSPTNNILKGFNHLVANYRPAIYAITLLIVGVSAYGVWKINPVSYMVDDLPEGSTIMDDLHFFENNFNGVMPLEIEINTGKKQGIRKYKNLKKIAQLEAFLDSVPEVSPPISLVAFSKAATQAYFNNKPEHYRLPTKREAAFIFRYLKKQNDPTGLLNSFTDSTGQIMRISLKVQDIGSLKMDSLVQTVLQPRITEIFAGTDIQAKITGTTPLFIKGNHYLIENLKTSLLIACVLVGIIMGFLFRNIRMVLLSLIPNLIPLLITAGLMGYLGIALKPSTALIFSIAFGIAVDDSIHFLAKFRQELIANNLDRFVAIKMSLAETGKSMIYTSIVLFAGFVIFVWSDFGGTQALGWLTSTTLLIAMFTNLILLPSLLWTFGAGINPNKHPIIEQYDTEEDEDIASKNGQKKWEMEL